MLKSCAADEEPRLCFFCSVLGPKNRQTLCCRGHLDILRPLGGKPGKADKHSHQPAGLACPRGNCSEAPAQARFRAPRWPCRWVRRCVRHSWLPLATRRRAGTALTPPIRTRYAHRLRPRSRLRLRCHRTLNSVVWLACASSGKPPTPLTLRHVAQQIRGGRTEVTPEEQGMRPPAHFRACQRAATTRRLTVLGSKNGAKSCRSPAPTYAR